MNTVLNLDPEYAAQHLQIEWYYYSDYELSQKP